MKVEEQRIGTTKKRQHSVLFWNAFGERRTGTVQATGDTSSLKRHGGGKAEGHWIYIYIYVYIYIFFLIIDLEI